MIDPFYLAEFNRVRRTYQDIVASSIALDGPSNESAGDFEEMEETDGDSFTDHTVSSFIDAAAAGANPATPTPDSSNECGASRNPRHVTGTAPVLA